MRRQLLLCAAALFLTACKGAGSEGRSPAGGGKPAEPSAQEKAQAHWSNVVNAPDRTDDDRKLDPGRKPAEMLELLDLKPGMKVAELGAGAGYTTELIARAVGPSGAVYAQNPPAFLNTFLKERWPARLTRPAMKGVAEVARDFDDPLPPEAKNLDEVVMNAIYHDTVWLKVDRARMDQAVFAALQPGGRFIVIDSSAKAGTGEGAAKELHRIDEELVKAEVLKAGFKLDGASDFLRNPQDMRDWNASPGAAGERRGTSDRFALRFVKPQGAAQAAGAARPDAPAPPRLRLPGTARPERAIVDLSIKPTDETFTGKIELQIAFKEPTQLLWLNADSLELGKIEAQSGNATQAGRVAAQDSNFVGLAFEQPLNGGVRLRIEYTGKLSRTDNDGAFKQEENGEWYVLSHMEPTGARRVFPCFDEPSFKIPWQLTLHVPRAENAFANTMPESDTTEGETRSVRFAETKPLPSYLVAFAVGPFEAVDAGKSKGGVPVRILVTKGKKAWATYSAKSSPGLLDAEAQYFGRPYEYGKLDLIEVPVGGGAMENPGLNTFGQRVNLRKPAEVNPAFQRIAASVEAHEFAHQWFGDLVTTAWWDDIWLNEAFATWDAAKTLDKVHPQWGSQVSAVMAGRGAMEIDALVAARRIRQPIETLSDVRNAFDGITYQKGAAVIGMFEAYVGADKFQKGVRRYLKEHANGNATASEFLAAISTDAGKDVTPSFSTFLDQAGVPLVTAQLSCAGGKGKVALSQERYLPLGSTGDAKAQSWQIPVCVKWGKGKGAAFKSGRACTLLTSGTGELALPSCADWVLPNEGSTGYYRSGFGDQLAALGKDLARLTVAERVGLASDALALARAGRLDYAQVLALVPQLAADKSRFVVASGAQLVAFLRDDELVSAAEEPKLAAFIRSSFGKRAHALGLSPRKGEDEDARILRPTLIELVGNQGEDPALRAEALKLAHAYLKNRAAVEAELAPTVLHLAALSNEPALFDELTAAAKASTERLERQRFLAALGEFDDPALVQKALQLTLDPALDGRESIVVLNTAARHPKSRALAVEFLGKSFDALVARLPRNAGAQFAGVASGYCDDRQKATLEALLKERVTKLQGGPRMFAQAMERLQLCSDFRKQQAPSVSGFLAQR